MAVDTIGVRAENERPIVAGENDHIVAEVAARIFEDLADPQTVNHANDERWKETLWHALSEAGLPLAKATVQIQSRWPGSDRRSRPVVTSHSRTVRPAPLPASS